MSNLTPQQQHRQKTTPRRSRAVDCSKIRVVSNLKPGDPSPASADLFVQLFGKQIRESLIQQHRAQK